MKLKVVKPKPKFYRISYAMLDNLLKKEKPVEQKKKVEMKKERKKQGGMPENELQCFGVTKEVNS